MTEATTQSAPANSGRLTYADPRNLPSYPSSGLPSDGAAAGAAATLGWNNQKPIELWKPDKLSSASAAAVLAKDYKMAPAWSPSSDSAGHQAALLAVGSANSALKHQRSQSSPQHQAWGNSAASQAFHASRPGSTRKSDLSHGSTAATQAFNISRSQSVRKSHTPNPSPQGDRSLAAAKGAMASTRRRAISTPADRDRPTAESAAANSRTSTHALDGAATAHRTSMMSKIPIDDAGAVPVTTMTRNMFTYHPRLKAEVDEEKNNERLHQSAVDMAKKMYNLQQHQRAAGQPTEHGEGAHGEHAPTYMNLQDAAYKQAQERLSKLQTDHTKSREMQEYYGNVQAPKRRFSVTHRLRRKHSPEGFDDREESERIRQQMSMFSSKLTEVDKTKRENDRNSLMAAAQRNVKAQLHGMDEKVYNDTGMVNPTLTSEWNLKAQELAQSRILSTSDDKGRLDLGGGMYMDQEQIDAIAAKRMQPVLDDLNEKAEKERGRLAALKLDDERRKEELAREKERDREAKELNRKIRDEDRQEEKLRRRKEKEEEKAEKAEKKRLAREEKRKSKHDSGVVAEDVQDEANGGEPTSASAGEDQAGHNETPRVGFGGAAAGAADGEAEPRATSNADEAGADSHGASGGLAPPGSKVKGWFKNRLSRGRSIGEHGDGPGQIPKYDQGDKAAKRRSFFFGRGGAKRTEQPNASATSLDNHSASVRDVALAGTSGLETEESRDFVSARSVSRADSRGVSPVSSRAGRVETQSQEHQDSSTLDIEPPRPLEDPGRPRSSSSRSRDSRFREEIE